MAAKEFGKELDLKEASKKVNIKPIRDIQNSAAPTEQVDDETEPEEEEPEIIIKTNTVEVKEPKIIGKINLDELDRAKPVKKKKKKKVLSLKN